MARGHKINELNAMSNDNIINSISYSGPERRLKDSPEFFGYFSLECIERRQNGYSLIKPIKALTPADR